MCKWLVRNRKLSVLIISFPIAVLILIYNIWMRPPLTWWIFGFFIIMHIILCSNILITLCAQTLLNRTIKILDNECDPYPMLSETTEQLKYSKSNKFSRLLIINKCVALNDLGCFKEALCEMGKLNPDDLQKKQPFLKFIYYNNFSAFYLMSEQIDHAEMMQKKALEYLSDINNDKYRNLSEHIVQINTALFLYYDKEYKQAEQLYLKNLEQLIDSKRNQIACSIGLAKIYLATDRLSEAKEKLQFVVLNGNKLFAVEQAKNLLLQYKLVEPAFEEAVT